MFRPKVDGPPGLRPGWPPPFDLDATDRPSTVGILRGVLIRENFREYLDHLLHDGCSVRCPQIDRLFACGFIGSRPDTLAIQAQVVPPRWQATLMLFNSPCLAVQVTLSPAHNEDRASSRPRGRTLGR